MHTGGCVRSMPAFLAPPECVCFAAYFDYAIAVISKGPGSTGFEAAMPGFGRNRAPRVRFSPGEADLNAYWGMCALHARVFSPPQGVLGPPRTSDCAIAVIS